jgi:hypothetical protein
MGSLWLSSSQGDYSLNPKEDFAIFGGTYRTFLQRCPETVVLKSFLDHHLFFLRRKNLKIMLL